MYLLWNLNAFNEFTWQTEIQCAALTIGNVNFYIEFKSKVVMISLLLYNIIHNALYILRLLKQYTPIFNYLKKKVFF